MRSPFTTDLLDTFGETVTGGQWGSLELPLTTSPCNSGIWEFELTNNTGGSTGGVTLTVIRPEVPGELPTYRAQGEIKFGPIELQLVRFVKEPVEEAFINGRVVDGVNQVKKVSESVVQASVGYPGGISFRLQGDFVFSPDPAEYWTIKGTRIFPT